jgi:hypothetical protein
MSEPKAVEIDAEVRQIKTMADGTVNLTLNLPEYCMPQAKILMGWVREMVTAVVQITGKVVE